MSGIGAWYRQFKTSTSTSILTKYRHRYRYWYRYRCIPSCESALSTMNMVQNKYRSTLTNDYLNQCLRLALTSLMPKFNAQKGVTFHTNKARPHHLLCIVQTFLLELCFWILTVTVPDPDLNGNLASGPFGFLIEYPCAITRSSVGD